MAQELFDQQTHATLLQICKVSGVMDMLIHCSTAALTAQHVRAGVRCICRAFDLQKCILSPSMQMRGPHIAVAGHPPMAELIPNIDTQVHT